MPPAADGAFARWLAGQAGELLRELRVERGFADPDRLRADGDKHAHHLIVTALTRWRPGDEVLSEEGVRDHPARLSAERVWIVDPLDGTREFGEPGRTDWAVHIGLWARTSAPTWYRWVRPAPRSRRSSRARSTRTSTPAASTSGTRPHRRLWRWPRVCTRAGWTAPRWHTIGRIRCSRTS